MLVRASALNDSGPSTSNPVGTSSPVSGHLIITHAIARPQSRLTTTTFARIVGRFAVGSYCVSLYAVQDGHWTTTPPSWSGATSTINVLPHAPQSYVNPGVLPRTKTKSGSTGPVLRTVREPSAGGRMSRSSDVGIHLPFALLYNHALAGSPPTSPSSGRS